jgi:hypothetical protein
MTLTMCMRTPTVSNVRVPVYHVTELLRCVFCRRRKSVQGGRRKSVADVSKRRKSVMATTPQELNSQLAESASGMRVGSNVWARMPPKHVETYEKGTVAKALSANKLVVKLPDGVCEEYAATDLLPY